MQKNGMPILGTHAANIALNKEIALSFLTSGPQDTFGLTEYSNESYLNDKLVVATWMIQGFASLHDETEEKPWVELPEWEIPDKPVEALKK